METLPLPINSSLFINITKFLHIIKLFFFITINFNLFPSLGPLLPIYDFILPFAKKCKNLYP